MADNEVTLKVGNTVVKMHKGRIEVMAVKNLKVEMSGANNWKARSAQQDAGRDAPKPKPKKTAGGTP